MNTMEPQRSNLLKGARLLIVDDDTKALRLMTSAIERAGATVGAAASGEEGLEMAANSDYDLMITDVQMPGIDGIELMRRVKDLIPDMETIVVTGHGDIPLAVRAMKEGAYDFITKPFADIRQVVTAAERALEKAVLQNRIEELESHIRGMDKFESLVGSSPQMQNVYKWISQVAPTESTVLIHGETGTGKELVARAIHARSNRANGPFIAVNCGTLAESLLDSELFGHLKGAFTGAHSTKIGLFEAANGGTIFLDEIDSTSHHTQLGLLRVLQDKEIRPVGSVSTKTVDVRVIVCSQKDLFKLAEEGKCREDLYYRISSLPIALPPLRERMGDIPLLSKHFLEAFCKRASKQIDGFSPEAMDLLTSYRWRGNVRELENVIKQAVLFSKKAIIERSDLAKLIEKKGSTRTKQTIETLDENEREHILRALRSAGDNKVLTAKMLGIQRGTLYKKMKKYGIPLNPTRDGLQEDGDQR